MISGDNKEFILKEVCWIDYVSQFVYTTDHVKNLLCVNNLQNSKF
jgi:hypothetical protein